MNKEELMKDVHAGIARRSRLVGNVNVSAVDLVIEAVREDIAFLIKQLDTIEHMQDHKKVAELAHKYNVKRVYER